MKLHKYYVYRTAAILAAAIGSATSARADAVTDWNGYWDEAVITAAQPAPAQARFAAILHVAIFDAVNGIAREYTPYYVTEPPPPGARQEAAAVQAAYTVLSSLYPAQQSRLDAHLADSLQRIPGAPGYSQSIAKGRAWGQYVAGVILQLRQDDGFTAQYSFFGGTDPGQWRSIPFDANVDGSLPAALAQVAYLTPFAMTSPSQFRPGPPYGAATMADVLASPGYAADVNEVKAIGRANSTVRTEEQTHLARLWQAIGGVDENRAARSVVPEGNKLVDNARLFALINMIGCDALVASMNSKFHYDLWRPHHAIRLAGTDGNPATEEDSNWTALILAPRFPEYVANHACLTGSMMHALARLLGDEHSFILSSPNYPVSAQFHRFSEAAEQAKEARIWGGIHFRNSCNVGEALGQTVADHVLDHFLLPLDRAIHANELSR